MHKKWFWDLFRRRVFVILMICIQAAFIGFVIFRGSEKSAWLYRIFSIISILVCLHIISHKNKGEYKLTWVFCILVFPVFGGLFYLLFKCQSSTRLFNKRLLSIEENTKPLLTLPGDVYKEGGCLHNPYISSIRYLRRFAGFPAYENTRTKYLSPGENMFSALTKELEKAEKYIFLEFFIVQEGLMWNTVLEILKKKAKEGVDIRIIYDDMGCFFLLPKDYSDRMAEYGIKCSVFNKFKPVLAVKQNNRDHRKIFVIDGKVSFTGGINLADEYINKIEKYGHWKDAAVMLEGEASWSFTIMFLRMWSLNTGEKIDMMQFYPGYEKHENDGLIIPYADSPTDSENVGENVYLNIINNAREYLYINTPYLIIDDSMLSALTLSAKSGVDVRIVTPHRWDKRFVHFTTRTYYRELIEAGVKIYEYSKGFIHSKTFVSDDTVAAVGTANLDFRSLYLHFECGAWMYKSAAVREVKEDFLNTLDVCTPIRAEDCKCGYFTRLLQEVFRLFAPLM